MVNAGDEKPKAYLLVSVDKLPRTALLPDTPATQALLHLPAWRVPHFWRVNVAKGV